MEVKSTNPEALEAQPSRSHSIINMRVVSVPLDPLREDIDILSEPSEW